ncbi:MAG TPA: hypothetical protein VF292_02825 [Rhodanobacteraceae bacterium]
MVSLEDPTCRASVIDLLQRARRLISAPGCWTRGASARDANGSACHTCDAEAACWCALGAVSHESGGGWASTAGLASTALAGAVKAIRPDADWDDDEGEIVVSFNDDYGRSQADVLAVFDRAITRLERIS